MAGNGVPLGVGIIGCGRIVGHHVAAIEASPDLELLAVCDLDVQRAEQMAPRPNVRVYRQYRQMLDENPGIDVVAIATPSGLHFPHARDVIDVWGKSVVIEKPPTLKFTELDELVELAIVKGAHVFPVFQYRFNAPVQRIRKGINDGELGAPRIISIRQRWCRTQRYYDQGAWRGTYSLDGGALTNQGIHHLDLIQYLGGAVEEVFAVSATFGSRIEAEDSIVATLKFASGAIGSLEITTATRPDDIESSVSILGENGYAVLGGWATDKLIAYSPNPDDTLAHSQSNTDAYGLGHRDIYDGVVRTIRGEGFPAVATDDARNVLRLLHAIYVSAAEARPVAIDENAEFLPLGAYQSELWKVYET
jgi:UDP-N-acetyl-2-amino-2-deoxyglucuronate dehydrogenase